MHDLEIHTARQSIPLQFTDSGMTCCRLSHENMALPSLIVPPKQFPSASSWLPDPELFLLHHQKPGHQPASEVTHTQYTSLCSIDAV